MMNYEQKLLRASTLHKTRIKKFCAPILTHFGITNFYLYKVTNAGHLYLLSNNLAWSEYFLTRHLVTNQPQFRHPSRYESCVYLLRSDDERYKDTIEYAREKFNVNFCMQIVDKVSDGVEVYGFDVGTSDRSHELLLLNEINLLRLFIKKFREENSLIFQTLVEEQIHIASIIGPDFYKLGSPIKPVISNREAFLEAIGMGSVTTLSKRELEIIRDVYCGLSAGQIATRNFISKRTVEHHIERIKDKLSCSTKAELFEQFRDLELLGYLNR